MSVERWLDVKAIQGVICKVIEIEKTKDYRGLGVQVFFNLDSYDGWVADLEVGLDPQQRKMAERAIAYYSWHVAFPKKKDRLLIIRDTKGREVARARVNDFDHTTDCPVK